MDGFYQMAEHLLLVCRHLGVVLDGERLLQRLQRVAVEDVVDAVYLLLPRHGRQVDVVDDPLRLQSTAFFVSTSAWSALISSLLAFSVFTLSTR